MEVRKDDALRAGCSFRKAVNRNFENYLAMSPLAVAATAAGTDHAASLFMKGIMENNGEAGAAEQLGPEQREQLLAALRERKRRGGHCGQAGAVVGRR